MARLKPVILYFHQVTEKTAPLTEIIEAPRTGEEQQKPLSFSTKHVNLIYISSRLLFSSTHFLGRATSTPPLTVTLTMTVPHLVEKSLLICTIILYFFFLNLCLCEENTFAAGKRRRVRGD